MKGMKMATPTLPVEVKDELRNLFIDGKLTKVPADILEQLRGFISSGVSSVNVTVNLAELIYARKDEPLPVELIRLAADAAVIAGSEYNFNDMRNNGRGAGINAELRKIKGVKISTPNIPDIIPEPDKRFTKPAEEAAIRRLKASRS
jgi:hypothetical protein